MMDFGIKAAIVAFFSALGLKLWPFAEPVFKGRAWLSFFFLFGIIFMLAAVLFITNGCSSFSLTPRSNSIFALQFSEQPPRTLIDMTCRGSRHVYEGIAVCEETTEKNLLLSVKIMPVQGRVVFSDGLTKKAVDFNWRKDKWLWWDTIVVDTTWVPIPFQKLTSIYGDVPLAFDVQGMSANGVINSRGIIYTRICNDKDIPCSHLIVNFDCAGKINNTYDGQMGSCARISGSSQKFSIPLKTPNYVLKEGAIISVQNGRDLWRITDRKVSADEVKSGELKFVYPSVLNGPSLFTITVYQWEQDVLQEYHAYVLLVGSSPNWTGIDRPHYLPSDGGIDFCIPFTADLMEVEDSQKIYPVTKDCVTVNPAGQVCAYAFDRESNDATYACVKNGKDVRYP